MHQLSELIEETGRCDAVCPNCGFLFDLAAMIKAATEGGDLDALMRAFRDDPSNEGIQSGNEDEQMSPLGHMMSENATRIESTINQYSAAFVANWFMNTAASIATVYGLAATGDSEKPFAKEG